MVMEGNATFSGEPLFMDEWDDDIFDDDDGANNNSSGGAAAAAAAGRAESLQAESNDEGNYPNLGGEEGYDAAEGDETGNEDKDGDEDEGKATGGVKKKQQSAKKRRCSEQLEIAERSVNHLPPPLWHSEAADRPHRKAMILEVARLLQIRKKSEPSSDWLRQLPHKARKLEERLYRNATSLEAYLDHSTLKNRLKKLARNIAHQFIEAKKNNSGRNFNPRASETSQTSRASSFFSEASSRASASSMESSAQLLRRSMKEAYSRNNSIGSQSSVVTLQTGNTATNFPHPSSFLGASYPPTRAGTSTQPPAFANTNNPPTATNDHSMSDHSNNSRSSVGSPNPDRSNQQQQLQPSHTYQKSGGIVPSGNDASTSQLSDIELQLQTNEMHRIQMMENIREQEELVRQLQGGNISGSMLQGASTGALNSGQLITNNQQHHAMNAPSMQQQQQQQHQQQITNQLSSIGGGAMNYSNQITNLQANPSFLHNQASFLMPNNGMPGQSNISSSTNNSNQIGYPSQFAGQMMTGNQNQYNMNVAAGSISGNPVMAPQLQQYSIDTMQQQQASSSMSLSQQQQQQMAFLRAQGSGTMFPPPPMMTAPNNFTSQQSLMRSASGTSTNSMGGMVFNNNNNQMNTSMGQLPSNMVHGGGPRRQSLTFNPSLGATPTASFTGMANSNSKSGQPEGPQNAGQLSPGSFNW